jgi:hypothetical protein
MVSDNASRRSSADHTVRSVEPAAWMRSIVLFSYVFRGLDVSKVSSVLVITSTGPPGTAPVPRARLTPTMAPPPAGATFRNLPTAGRTLSV